MPSTKKLSLADLRVGLLVLGSLILLFVLILSASGELKPFEKRFIVRTRVSEVDGLSPGNEVRLAGVTVGKVDSVKFGEIPATPGDQNTVEILMSVDPKAARDRIRSDSLATLGSIGLLGDKVVEISPGTKNGTPLESGGLLRSSETGNIRKIISGVDPLIGNLADTLEQLKSVTNKINEGKGTLGQLINNPRVYQDLDSAVLAARDLLERVRAGDGTAGRIINDPGLYEDARKLVQRLESVSKAIEEGPGTLSRLIHEPELYDRLSQASDRLNRVAGRIETVSAKIESGEGTIGKLVNDPRLHDETAVTVTNLKNITGRLDRGEGTAGAILHDRKLYDNLNQATSELVRLLYDFRQNPGRFLKIRVTLF
ncbi:MAG: MCE family protein [Acidobacteria bacterium]|nr:MCE family protein [Acidobacteriota bacterium]